MIRKTGSSGAREQEGVFRGKSFKRNFFPFKTKAYFREKGLKRLPTFFNQDSEKIYFPKYLSSPGLKINSSLFK